MTGGFFFQPAGSIWQYGDHDTAESVYGSNIAYTPNRTYSGEMHEDATLAFGHRRLSINGQQFN